jgi:hypothetical protein
VGIGTYLVCGAGLPADRSQSASSWSRRRRIASARAR